MCKNRQVMYTKRNSKKNKKEMLKAENIIT